MKTRLFLLGRRQGFTLIELLVSITILSIILIVLGSAISFVSRLWLAGIGSVDNFTKARVMLSLLDRDIQMMVMRRDVAAFVDSSGNPSCAFYTNVQGYNSASASSDTRAVSLVQYSLATTTTPVSSILQRLNYGMNFTTTAGTTPVVALNPVPPGVAKLTQLPAVSTSNTEILATGVIFFQWQFVDGSGNILDPPYGYTPVSGSPSTPFYYNFSVPGTSSNPRAVIISMLVLNNPGYILATQNSSTIGHIKSLFPLSGSASLYGNQTPLYSQYWNTILNPTVGVFDSGKTLPAPVRTGLQVFQRYIPLPVSAVTTSS